MNLEGSKTRSKSLLRTPGAKTGKSLSDGNSRRNEVKSMLEEALQAGQDVVNLNRPAPVGVPSVPTSTGAAPVAASGGASGDLTEAAFNSTLQKLIAATGGKVSVTSGKRSAQRQKELWAQALEKYGDPEIADNWVARPGGSRHESGLAADLKFADDATKALVHQLAAEYGLYFPMEHEPWHIELKGTRG